MKASTRRLEAMGPARWPWPVLPLILLLAAVPGRPEHVRDLEVSEGAPVGTRIGFIGDGALLESGPPYLIVPVTGSAVDSDLAIDQNTGEISTKVPLDRERRASYSLVAIPLSGDNVRVMVRVLDENDNAPTFPAPVMHIEFPENTPRDVKRTLHPARDLDLGIYNTQRYNIVSGNVNNAFRLSSHRERDGVLYLDLQINGFLDRETVPEYSLVIEALDGGSPPLKGEMIVNITIQDVNDNQPIFNQSRYFASVPENATVGTTVLQVFATDADSGENGQVEYSINRRQSDRDSMFRIDSSTGLVAVNKPLDFETKELHELVIVAKDHGLQPLETTAFVSIRVTDVNDNQPQINVIFLSDDATPKISESAQPGEFVARISVHDPDSKTEYSNINVTLSGGDGHFGLTTRDNIIYLVIVSLPLDREVQPNYTLSVVATDTGTPPLHASRTIHLQVTDINDNAPEFEREVYQANVMEVSDPGTSIVQVTANDKDEGNNSAISYALVETPDTHSQWFQIDSRSGLVTTRAHVDCETDPVPQLTVIATDNGFPPLSSTATVLVTIHDVNDNEPIFDQSFYNVSVAENEAVGRCILKVSATDPDCGVNAMVNYTLGDGFGKLREFEVRSGSGEVCITAALDYETRNMYEFPIVATDRGGLSTTAMVKIQLSDINDNRPAFYPREYNVSLREGGASSSTNTPVVVVVATDPDSGRYGSVSYRIVAGNEAGLFRIDRNTGEIFVSRPSLLSTRNQPYHRLNISATDGAGLRAAQDAEVFISVIDSAQRPPIFEHTKYTFSVSENVKRNTVVGSVKATVSDSGGRRPVRYSIYSGDPDGYFTIDPITGTIKTAETLDHEAHASLLLNIQATSGDPPSYGHAQVNIEIKDVNDNPPEFESGTVRISVPENVELGVPLYAAHARDKDSGDNGIVQYKIVSGAGSSAGGLFAIEPRLGHLTLTRHLDYETTQRHSLVVTATDKGNPQLSANLTILVEVQDVNDNLPVFEQAEYTVKVSEAMPVNSQILQVTAVDLDTGNNARLTYRLVPSPNMTAVLSEEAELFGIFPNSGWLYLRGTLDREYRDRYDLTVAATDNGTPSETATARVVVQVLDANDNDPRFAKETYEFTVEENLRRGAVVGTVFATDADLDTNAVVKYNLIPGNTSFHINSVTGEIVTREPLDRETKGSYDLVAEARDQGTPSRSTRVSVRVLVSDVNDNSPVIVDPQEDVVSVREEQPPGTEVVRVRAMDSDSGYNASVTYSILKGRDSDGYGMFTIDPVSGVIRTRLVLDHEERAIYRLAVAATDSGKPPRQTVRLLRVEVLDLNDNRPTFTSSSLVFNVREDVKVGHIVGSVATSDPSDNDNLISGGGGIGGGHITYTLTSLISDHISGAFDIDRSTGSLVVARELDRETQSEYRLEVRALDTSAMNNPQSSAVTVRVDVTDANDNAPKWSQDPITIPVAEDTPIGTAVYNFTATDSDSGPNGEIRYTLVKNFPAGPSVFTVDALTGTLTLIAPLDYETLPEYTLIVKAMDQSTNASERLSTSVTARIIVTDFNDNGPKFVFPATSAVTIGDGVTVGMVLSHLVAVDADSGDNGRVTYVISAGNEDGRFSLGYDSGVLTLAKPIISDDEEGESSYTLNVTASDHGTPTKHANLKLKLTVRGSAQHPPRFLNSVYKVKVSEDAPVGSFVVKVTAKSAFLEAGGNLSYHIPSGIADDLFTVDARTGVVSTRGALDRERTDEYTVPVYVTDSGGRHGSSADHSSQFDVAMITIQVTDVNDHAPEFRPGACYPLSVPENGDLAVIHRVVAMDLDSGLNGEITYTITAGNVGNKFSIDARTGELTARPLDRESQGRYLLTITAQDRGSPAPLQGSCNISVRVDDQNDNDPRFDSPRYAAMVPEDAPTDTSVVRVRATDADLGLNARIIYSLANESHWLFRIDNKTGVITTAGQFDRERKDSYEFLVVATDQGKYDARSTKVPVKITVTDVNDNKPIFTKYPFKEKIAAFLQPGQTLLQVSATDADIGINADIVYSLVNEPINSKFRINPNSGVLTASQSLASENGRIIYLHVSATDKGNPPRSSTGLVEISVGDVPASAPRLRFQNTTYILTLPENTAEYTEVAQLSAVRTDGRRQRITYTFGRGNEENAFSVDQDTGRVRVRDSSRLDYERNPEMRMVIEARADGSPTLYGYCTLIIRLTDQNDNSPRFTQQQYSSSVWEGNSKGTFVMQIAAFDDDQGQNSRVLYHIVDGNHDNAFIIEPAFSGIVKTNIVLDREIRDTYRLTVIATDEGVPQMTGTARIRINIVDINDNQPTFPPHSIITISEATEVGTVLTAVTANDVDTNPALTYSFAHESDPDSINMFSIDRFSGKVILSKRLDYEMQQEYQLKVTASDTAHTANTMLTIRVTDVNDNAPVFQQPAYHALLPDGRSDLNLEVLRVNASDADNGDNAKIHYSLLKPIRGFTIGEFTGVIYVNQSELPSRTVQDVQLAVVATDSGTPPLQSVASIRIKINSGNGAQPHFTNKEYKVRLSEDSPRGTTVVEISPPEMVTAGRRRPAQFFIADGNEDGTFEVANPNGVIMLVRSLDRETKDSYTLHLVAGEPGLRMHEANSSVVTVYVAVDDANDNAPLFQQTDYEVTISEATPIGTSVLKVVATDADQIGTPGSDILYDVTSGNDLERFELDQNTGILTVKNALDYDDEIIEHSLVVRACDQALNQLCSMTSIQVTLQDENDNAPRFPVTEYLEFVGENEPIGTAVFTAHATDLDKGVFGTLNYSIVSAASSGYGGIDDSWKMFRVDPTTGLVTTAAVFDYEQRSRYVFSLRASDFGGRSASVRVRIEIESRDEFHPQFTERTYRFVLATPASGNLPVGYVVGHVTATDRDKGPDGRVVYQLTALHPHFKMNRTTGAVTVKKKLDNAAASLDAGRDISLVVTASSGRQGSLTNMTVVEIVLDPLADPGTNLASSGHGPGYGHGQGNNGTAVAPSSGGLADWALGLLIALVLVVLCFGGVFLYLHMRNRRNKIVNKPNLSATDGVTSTNNYVDPCSFDTMGVRTGGNGVGAAGQFAPPKYDEIPPYGPGHHPASSNSGAATTSELSGSEQSGSSGRGSAEDGDDGDDEEIRMINEGPLQRDSGIMHRQNDVDVDDDNLSDVSVHNTQEYLARLGIVNSGGGAGQAQGQSATASSAKDAAAAVLHHQGVPMDPHMHMFDEEGAGEPDITNLIYAKLNDVTAGSDRASSADEGAGGGPAAVMGAFGDVVAPHHQPSMNGSLSSIVHSEEELTGSYNWDYLLDWGPQYQPLAHVFSEIARLKDDSASVQSAASGGSSSVKSKGSAVVAPPPSVVVVNKSVPPPLLTNVAPRSIQIPTLSSRGGVGPSSSHHVLPRSPISHDASGATFSTSTAMSPSFSPSLSPLATKSPSISPLVAPGLPTSHHVVRQPPQPRSKTVVDAELRI